MLCRDPPKLKSAFCGCNVKNGSLVILYISLFNCWSAILTFCYGGNRGYSIDDGIKRFAKCIEPCVNRSGVEILKGAILYMINDSEQIALIFKIGIVVTNCVVLIALFGIYKRIPQFMVPILIWGASVLLCSVPIILLLMFATLKYSGLMFLVMVSSSLFAFGFYCCWILYSHYLELQAWITAQTGNVQEAEKYTV